jgi:hypothetical protein
MPGASPPVVITPIVFNHQTLLCFNASIIKWLLANWKIKVTPLSDLAEVTNRTNSNSKNDDKMFSIVLAKLRGKITPAFREAA